MSRKKEKGHSLQLRTKLKICVTKVISEALPWKLPTRLFSIHIHTFVCVPVTFGLVGVSAGSTRVCLRGDVGVFSSDASSVYPPLQSPPLSFQFSQRFQTGTAAGTQTREEEQRRGDDQRDFTYISCSCGGSSAAWSP